MFGADAKVRGGSRSMEMRVVRFGSVISASIVVRCLRFVPVVRVIRVIWIVSVNRGVGVTRIFRGISDIIVTRMSRVIRM